MRILIAMCIVLGLQGAPAPSAGASTHRDSVLVNPSSRWYRRDWKQCNSGASLAANDSMLTVLSDTSDVLFWCVPTTDSATFGMDASQRWLRECDRPPSEFGRQLRQMDRNEKRLLAVSDYRFLSWQWSVDGTIDDRRPGKPNDIFTARLGVTLLSQVGDRLREISYVWARSQPEDKVFVEKTTVIPGVWQYRWHRIVVQTGEPEPGKWEEERRNIYRDYKRLYPDEEPGRIIRIYLRVDSDDPKRPIVGAFSRIRFHRAAAGSGAQGRDGE